MSRPGSDNSPGSSPLAAPEAAAEDTRAQALSLAREAVQAEVAVFGEEQREELRLKFKSLDEVEGGFGTALMKTFPDSLPKPEMLGKTRGTLAQLAVLFEPDQAELAAILTLGVGRTAGGAAELFDFLLDRYAVFFACMQRGCDNLGSAGRSSVTPCPL